VRKTPTLASSETLYGSEHNHPSPPPPPPTRSTESLYGFLPQAATTYGGGYAGGQVSPARSSGGLTPLQCPPRNTLERRKIHFNPFEEYSD
jgi:hypothetical protein